MAALFLDALLHVRYRAAHRKMGRRAIRFAAFCLVLLRRLRAELFVWDARAIPARSNVVTGHRGTFLSGLAPGRLLREAGALGEDPDRLHSCGHGWPLLRDVPLRERAQFVFSHGRDGVRSIDRLLDALRQLFADE